ncbi:MAG: TIGR02147 family protein, partial [Deltaproteobacteria bacterium]|nr:TIGR02147 family protein [Deltaproteobacteria bacterium]
LSFVLWGFNFKPMRTANQPSIFSYLDYRLYLKDWYQLAKASRASFSFRAFSQRSGFASPNFFKLVMDGQRNLTEASLKKFVKGLGLNKQEQDFFRYLVFFTQAKSSSEKDRYYKLLIQSKKFKQLKPLEKKQYNYYSAWYHPVIRELITAADFDGTADFLVKRIKPIISLAQAEASLELLKNLGLIRLNKKNKWEQSDSVLSTGAEVKSVVLFNYHKNLLSLSQEVLEKTPAKERDISAMTLGLSRDKIPLIKQKIQKFRQEILKLVSDETQTEEVLQLNIQMFPVTSKSEGEV